MLGLGIAPLSETNGFSSSPLALLSSDWLPLTNSRFEQHLGEASMPEITILKDLPSF